MTLIIDTEWEQFKYCSDSKKLQKFYYEDTIDIVVFVIIECGIMRVKFNINTIDNLLAFSKNILYDAIKVIGITDIIKNKEIEEWINVEDNEINNIEKDKV